MKLLKILWTIIKVGLIAIGGLTVLFVLLSIAVILVIARFAPDGH